MNFKDDLRALAKMVDETPIPDETKFVASMAWFPKQLCDQFPFRHDEMVRIDMVLRTAMSLDSGKVFEWGPLCRPPLTASPKAAERAPDAPAGSSAPDTPHTRVVTQFEF